eukprot:Skav223085  [mRNA]  locus=scaffold419:274039:276991:+ [translate_table: standard]
MHNSDARFAGRTWLTNPCALRQVVRIAVISAQPMTFLALTEHPENSEEVPTLVSQDETHWVANSGLCRLWQPWLCQGTFSRRHVIELKPSYNLGIVQINEGGSGRPADLQREVPEREGHAPMGVRVAAHVRSLGCPAACNVRKDWLANGRRSSSGALPRVKQVTKVTKLLLSQRPLWCKVGYISELLGDLRTEKVNALIADTLDCHHGIEELQHAVPLHGSTFAVPFQGAMNPTSAKVSHGWRTAWLAGGVRDLKRCDGEYGEKEREESCNK